jgi:hypothetical protein
MPKIDPSEDQAKKLDPASPAAIESTYNLQGIKPGPMKAAPPINPNTLANKQIIPGQLGGGIAGETNPEIGIQPETGNITIVPKNQQVKTSPSATTPVAPPPATYAPVAEATQTLPPVAEATQTLPPVGQAKSATGAGPVTTEVSGGTDSVKAASSTPGFWQQALTVASNTGKTIMELLGDFASGYSHQQSSPTEQRIAREHELRMQGNQVQAQKDLVGIQQGFQKQQADLDRQLQSNLATARNDIEREKMKQDYQYQTQSLRNQSLQIQNQYHLESLMKSLEIQQDKVILGSFLSRHQ